MAANDVQIQIIGKDLASAAFKQVDSAAQNTARNMESFGGSISSVNNLLSNTVGFTAAIAGFEGLQSAIGNTLGSATEFYKTMETGSISMSGTLMSMATLNGETIQWGQALAMSKDLMMQLSDTALRTGVSTHELTDTFRAMLPAALNAKMTVQQTMDLASRLVPVGKGMGLNDTTLMRDVADLITGNNVQRTKLGSILGISDNDIKQAKQSAGGLYAFLSERLQGEKAASENYLTSLDGRINHLKESVSRMGGTALGPVFQAGTDELQKMADSIVKVDKETGEITLNPQLLNDLSYAGKDAMEFYTGIKAFGQDVSVVVVPAVKILGTGLDLVAKNVESIGLGLTAWMVIGKVSALFADYTAVVNGAKEAQTFLGQAVLDTQTKYARQALAAEEAAAAERAAAEQARLASMGMDGATTAASIGYKKLSLSISEAVIAQDMLVNGTSRSEAAMAAASEAEIAGQSGLAKSILSTNLTLEEQGALTLETSERMVLAAQLAETGQFNIAQSVMVATLGYNAEGNAAAITGEKEVVASTESSAAQRELTASVAATTLAHAESGTAATLAGEKTALAIGTAKTAAGNFLSSLWALAGGWAGVAVATGFAIKALVDYFDTKNKVDSYDSKAEVYDDPSRPGMHLKKAWVDNASTDQRGNTLPGWGRVPLSDAEEEERSSWKTWKDQQDNNKPWRSQSVEDLMAGLTNRFDPEEKSKKKGQHKKASILDEAGDLKYVIEDASNSAGVNPELFAALVKAESDFNPSAESSAGAIGLSQLMPGTAAEMGVSNPWDASENAQGGAEYLAQMLQKFGGNTRLGLAAYNAGPQAVANLVQQYGASWSAVSEHLPDETQAYVAKITGYLENANQMGGLKTGNFAQKLKEMQQKMAKMMLTIDGKINSEKLLPTRETETMKLDAEIGNMTNESNQMKVSGINTDALNAKIAQYKQVASDKIIKNWNEAWQDLQMQSNITHAQLAGDTSAEADAEYDSTINKLKVEKEKKWRDVGLSSDSFANEIANLNKFPGLKEAGNIDLTKRPLVKNKDGSVSTVRSMGINVNDEEVLVPTVSEDGRIMSDEEATKEYLKTGKHLGKFASAEDSTAYAEKLHQQQELYAKNVEANYAVEKWYNDQVLAAEKKRLEQHRADMLTKYGYDVQYNNDLLTLGKKTATEVNDWNLQVYNREIQYLQGELSKPGLSPKDRIDLENQLAGATKSKNDILATNYKTAYPLAAQDIKNQLVDYRKAYEDTWSSIDGTVKGHIESIISLNEGLGKGIKSTILGVSQSITKMFADILYQTYVMQPVKDWFTNLLGGTETASIPASATNITKQGSWGTGSSYTSPNNYSFINPLTSLLSSSSGSTSSAYSASTGGGFFNLLPAFADGGYNPGGWSLVGEKGPELANFSNPARIYTASDTQKMLSSNKSQRPINMNMNISTNDVQSFRKSKGQIIGEVGRMMRSVGRNT